MTDETTALPAEAEKMEEVPAPSTSAEQVDGADVDAEAKKLMAVGSRDLVMKDVRSAVNAFQEASSLLGKKYGETADQCADAFYYYGMALLELARMENNVLGNALEGMPEEEDEESDKDPNIPSASNLDEKEREELREQVYDAMAEKDEKANKEGGDSKETAAEEMECEKSSDAAEAKDEAKGESAEAEKATEGKPDSSSEAAGEESKTEAAGEKESKTEAAGEKESKTEAASKPESSSEAAVEKESKTKAKGEKESKTEAAVEKESKTKAKGEKESKTEAASKPESSSEAVGEEKSKSETAVEKESKAEAASKPESSSEAVGEKRKTEAAGDKNKTEAESKPESSSEAAGEEKSKTETAVEKESKAEAESKPESSSEAAGEEKMETEAAEKKKTDEGEADSTQGPEDKPEGTKDSEAAVKSEEKDKTEGDEAEPMEGEEGNGEEGSESENEEAEEKETEEEDVGNLQLAWEMLDLSKIIFQRHPDKASQLKAAQAHLKLGEVSIESENYTQAVEDFLACLTIQKEHLEGHDRLLAETHYQLGLAYQYSCKHEDAISHFTQSIDTIEKRLAVLTEQEKASEESKEETQKEMDELKGLLPDIKEKIEDSKEAQKTAEDTDKALKETLGETSSGFPKENGGTSKPAAAAEKSGDCTVPVTNCVSDISHLVRKKRKPEEESPLKEAKKSKPDPVENGSGSGDAVVPTNEKAEAENETPMETAAVESTS